MALLSLNVAIATHYYDKLRIDGRAHTEEILLNTGNT